MTRTEFIESLIATVLGLLGLGWLVDRAPKAEPEAETEAETEEKTPPELGWADVPIAGLTYVDTYSAGYGTSSTYVLNSDQPYIVRTYTSGSKA